ncbi:putative phage abortive infection protein [Labilibaculum euxinus]
MNVKVISILAIVLVAIWLGLYSWKCRNRIKNYKWVFEWFYPCIVFLISINVLYLLVNRFIEATAGEFTWHMKIEAWSYFGAFIGAILLAATLIYQIRASRRQQVESKFFELVKYYRDNISEMRIRNPFFYGNRDRVYEEEFVEGRRVMKLIFDQYRVAFGLCSCKENILLENKNVKDNVLKDWIAEKNKKQFEKYFKDIKSNVGIDRTSEVFLRFIENEAAYLIMFWGVSRGAFKELEDKLESQYVLLSSDSEEDNTAKVQIIEEIKKMVAVYDFLGNTISKEQYSQLLNAHLKQDEGRQLINISNSKGRIKFFGGQQYQLGHYFRHLYQAVNYIDSQSSLLFSKDEKYEYIKTLRAQMSNYEQALLFINSLTIMGRNWEYNNPQKKKLITTYNLIKNLPENFIPKMNPKDYYPNVDFEWKSKKVKKSLIKLKFDNRVSV